jgi:hypothetical protein
MSAKTIRVNDVGPEPGRESADLTASVDRRDNHARSANRELH